MNFKTTYLLFGSLVLLLGVAAIFLLTGPKQGEEGRLFPSARADKIETKDIDRVEIDRKAPKEEKLVLVRLDDKRWRMEKPYAAKVDASAVEGIVRDVLEARKEAKAEAPASLAQVGLDSPPLVVTVTRSRTEDRPEKSYSLSLGGVTPGGLDALVYGLSSEDSKQPAAIRKSSLNSLFRSEEKAAANAGELLKPAGEFRSKELLLEGAGFNAAEVVKSVKLTDGKTEVVLSKQPNGTWKYDKPANFGTADAKGDFSQPPAATDVNPPGGVEPLLTALANLRPAAADDFIDNVNDLAQYGLEKDKEVGPKIEIERTAPAGKPGPAYPEKLFIGKKDDAANEYFARLDGESTVAKLPANLVEPIRKLLERPGAMRDRQLLTFAPIGCDGIDIKLAGEEQPLELRRMGDPPSWRVFDAAGQSQLANTAAIAELLTALGGKIVKDFPDPNASDAVLGFDKPAAEVALYVGGIIKEEKKDPPKEEKKPEPAKTEPKDALKTEPKDKAKADSKDAPKSDAKDAPKTEPKDKARAESKETPKAAEQDAPKSESKDAPKTEAKDAAKPEAKDVPKAESKDKTDTKDAPKESKKEEPKKEPEIARPKMKEPSARLIFGKRDKDLLYVRRVEGNTKTDFALTESLLTKITRGRIDYLDPTLPSFVQSNAVKVTFNRGAETFVIERKTTDSKTDLPTWVIQQPSDRAGRTADAYKVEQILGVLSGLRAERLWAEKPNDRELERYGVKPPKLQAAVTVKDDKETKDIVYQFGGETDDKQGVYAKHGGRDLVFVARKDATDGLLNAEVQDPVVYRLDVNKVKGMKLTGWKDIVGSPVTRDLERRGSNNWAVKSGDAMKVNSSQAEAFLSNLAPIRAEKFVVRKTGPRDEHKLAVPAGALQIELTVDGEKDPVTLTIGGPDVEGKHFFAMCSTAPGDVFLLPKDRFEAVKAKPGYFAAE